MTKISLSMGETKSKIDLALEGKDVGITLADAPWTLAEDDSTLAAPRYTLGKESKTKVDLTLGETK